MLSKNAKIRKETIALSLLKVSISLFQFSIQFVIVRKSGQQELEAMSHMTSTVKHREQKINSCMYPTLGSLSFSFSLGLTHETNHSQSKFFYFKLPNI